MQQWYECKVKYEKTMEDGKLKNVSEGYLVDAMSFTEAEARINKELSQYISGEFNVANISKSRLAEIFDSETGEAWYKCKVAFVIIDEKSGKEKKVSSQMLVNAVGVKDAFEMLDKEMQKGMSDYDIQAVVLSNIYDVFGFEVSDDEDTTEDPI